METYKNKIAGNDKLELIMASGDQDAKAALAWAKQHSFPWPTVLMKKIQRAGLAKYRSGFVPHYVLIDKDGRKLAEGKAACLSKAAELAK